MELNYKTFGQGEPLLILHGLFGSLDNWQTLGKRLSEHYSVYLIDQRNHGRSPHQAPMDYPIMADDLRQFMEQQFIHRANIMGHSMGGKTAMEFALRNPDMTEKLIVIDIGPKAYAGGHEMIFKALQAVRLEEVKDRKYAENILQQYIDNPAIRQFLLKNLARSKAGTFRWKINLPLIYAHYEDILAAPKAEGTYEGATLFLRGGLSDYILEDDEEQIGHYFPNYELQTVENAGHWVHAEAPDALFAAVRTFLG